MDMTREAKNLDTWSLFCVHGSSLFSGTAGGSFFPPFVCAQKILLPTWAELQEKISELQQAEKKEAAANGQLQKQQRRIKLTLGTYICFTSTLCTTEACCFTTDD
jgi:hypothetical protein